MCFYILQGHLEMKTAKRDIVCYKEGHYFSPKLRFTPKYRYGYVYRVGELNKIEGKWPSPTSFRYYEIDEGFHSYSNKKRLSRKYDWVKCIIPKGAYYFYNPEDKEYVSNQIIVQEFIHN